MVKLSEAQKRLMIELAEEEIIEGDIFDTFLSEKRTVEALERRKLLVIVETFTDVKKGDDWYYTCVLTKEGKAWCENWREANGLE